MRSMGVVALILVGLVVCSCGMAIRSTDRDYACTERGGHLEGLVRMECVVP